MTFVPNIQLERPYELRVARFCNSVRTRRALRNDTTAQVWGLIASLEVGVGRHGRSVTTAQFSQASIVTTNSIRASFEKSRL